MAGLRTEYPFTLPKGYVDGDGAVHHDGTMRLATARDELEPLNDPKVRDADDPYLTVIVLARVITALGPHSRLSARDIENLFAADLAYLQDVYATINYGTESDIERFLAPRPAPAPVTSAPAPPMGSQGSPVSDAARALTAQPLVPAADADAEEEDDSDEPMEMTRAPRRARIEEVGRSSGRPR